MKRIYVNNKLSNRYLYDTIVRNKFLGKLRNVEGYAAQIGVYMGLYLNCEHNGVVNYAKEKGIDIDLALKGYNTLIRLQVKYRNPNRNNKISVEDIRGFIDCIKEDKSENKYVLLLPNGTNGLTKNALNLINAISKQTGKTIYIENIHDYVEVHVANYGNGRIRVSVDVKAKYLEKKMFESDSFISLLHRNEDPTIINIDFEFEDIKNLKFKKFERESRVWIEKILRESKDSPKNYKLKEISLYLFFDKESVLRTSNINIKTENKGRAHLI